MKSIIASDVLLNKEQFRPDSMTEKLPDDLKNRILRFLKSVPDVLLSDSSLIDPVTGKKYETTNIIREKNGYIWSTHTIYMLEHYDVRLSKDFLQLFERNN